MEPKTTDQSTNHTPGTAPGSGSGAAPMSGEPSPKSAGSEFGASGSSSSDASGSPSDVSFRGNTGGSSGAGASGNTGGSMSGAGNLKNTIADRLEAGAEVVRSKGGSMSLSGATGDGSVGLGEEGKLAHMGGVVADSMKAAASWVREADIDGIKDGLEKQVKEHPARSLLVAVGVGYLLGKAFRR